MMPSADIDPDTPRDTSRHQDGAGAKGDSLPHGELPPRRPTSEDSEEAETGTMSVEPFRGPGQETAEVDDAVHFDVAARALKVSRRTVERMVKRGELEREETPGPLGVAKVSKRSLVKALDWRRQPSSDLSELSRDMSRHDESPASGPDLNELIEALIDQVVDARTTASALEAKVDALQSQPPPRVRDDLLATLVAGGWSQRRRARKTAIAELVQGMRRRDPEGERTGEDLALPE